MSHSRYNQKTFCQSVFLGIGSHVEVQRTNHNKTQIVDLCANDANSFGKKSLIPKLIKGLTIQTQSLNSFSCQSNSTEMKREWRQNAVLFHQSESSLRPHLLMVWHFTTMEVMKSIQWRWRVRSSPFGSTNCATATALLRLNMISPQECTHTNVILRMPWWSLTKNVFARFKLWRVSWSLRGSRWRWPSTIKSRRSSRPTTDRGSWN